MGGLNPQDPAQLKRLEPLLQVLGESPRLSAASVAAALDQVRADFKRDIAALVRRALEPATSTEDVRRISRFLAERKEQDFYLYIEERLWLEQLSAAVRREEAKRLERTLEATAGALGRPAEEESVEGGEYRDIPGTTLARISTVSRADAAPAVERRAGSAPEAPAMPTLKDALWRGFPIGVVFAAAAGAGAMSLEPFFASLAFALLGAPVLGFTVMLVASYAGAKLGWSRPSEIFFSAVAASLTMFAGAAIGYAFGEPALREVMGPWVVRAVLGYGAFVYGIMGYLVLDRGMVARLFAARTLAHLTRLALFASTVSILAWAAAEGLMALTGFKVVPALAGVIVGLAAGRQLAARFWDEYTAGTGGFWGAILGALAVAAAYWVI